MIYGEKPILQTEVQEITSERVKEFTIYTYPPQYIYIYIYIYCWVCIEYKGREIKARFSKFLHFSPFFWYVLEVGVSFVRTLAMHTSRGIAT